MTSKQEKHCICPFCEEEMQTADMAYCQACNVTMNYCPECKIPVSREEQACPQCGAELKTLK